MTRSQLCLSPLVAALVGAVVLGACGRQEEPILSADALAQTGLGADMEDAAITTLIAVELARDDALDPTRIDIDTAQGRVVLRGSAPDEAAKERAKRIALAVAGVKAVDNHLTVANA